jgi:hypothetical protein
MIDTTGNPLIVCNFMRNWYNVTESAAMFMYKIVSKVII